jgi:hypothetical protein
MTLRKSVSRNARLTNSLARRRRFSRRTSIRFHLPKSCNYEDEKIIEVNEELEKLEEEIKKI